MATDLFTFTGEIGRAAANSAVQWLVDNAEEIARRKAIMIYQEDRLRVVKSTVMALSNEKSIAAKEAAAYRSARYIEAVEEKRNSVFSYERLMNSKLAAQATKELYQTHEASSRRAI